MTHSTNFCSSLILVFMLSVDCYVWMLYRIKLSKIPFNKDKDWTFSPYSHFSIFKMLFTIFLCFLAALHSFRWPFFYLSSDVAKMSSVEIIKSYPFSTLSQSVFSYLSSVQLCDWRLSYCSFFQASSNTSVFTIFSQIISSTSFRWSLKYHPSSIMSLFTVCFRYFLTLLIFSKAPFSFDFL